MKSGGPAKPTLLTKNELAARVQLKAADILKVSSGELRPETRWVADLEADSLDLMELAAVMEHELGIRIEDDELVHLQTVQDACDLIWESYSQTK